MRISQCIYSGVLAALVASLSSGEASAHDFAAHDAIVRAATSAMHFWVEDGTTANFCPNPGELPTDADFAEYQKQVATALKNLPKLRTGLKPVQYDSSSCNQTTTSDGSVTGYYPEDNLQNIGQFRIEDFRYVVARDYEKGCGGLEGLHDYPGNNRLTNEKWRTLGSVLGTVAGDVDNRTRDTVLWIKPLNAGVWGLAKDALSLGVTIAGAVFLAPVACLWSFFSGSGDCGDAKKWAIKYNPVDYAAGLIPGIPCDFTGADLGIDINGVWHFQQTNSTGNNVSFANDPAGMWYPIAGPNLIPGVLDVAIMAATSATGVSLNADESLGVRDFGQFDEADRFKTSWEAHAFSNTEFTPVSKLAKYGKQEYDASGHTVAAGLGYPLHAFADATFPHHIANTTAHGHRPMEDAINNVREISLQFTTSNDLFKGDNLCHRPVELILEGYTWWQRYHLGRPGSHVDVEDAVESLASAARDWVDDHSRVWSDTASDTYLIDKERSIESYTVDSYSGLTLSEFAEPLAVHAVGASIAFLVDTGKDVADVQKDPSTQCPPGKSYYYGVGCQTPPSPTTLPPGKDVSVTGGKKSCKSNDDCPSGLVCAKAGPNAQTCVAFGSEGTSCLSDSYCAAGLACATSGTNAGTCIKKGTTGTSCSSDNECAGGFACAKVGTNAGTCIKDGDLGTSCSANNDCSAGLACAATGANAGTCVLEGTNGTLCSTDSSCATGFVCATVGADARTCVTTQATVGNTCYSASDCQGPNIVCGAQNKCCVVVGATCQSTSECCYTGSPYSVICSREDSMCGIIG